MARPTSARLTLIACALMSASGCERADERALRAAPAPVQPATTSTAALAISPAPLPHQDACLLDALARADRLVLAHAPGQPCLQARHARADLSLTSADGATTLARFRAYLQRSQAAGLLLTRDASDALRLTRARDGATLTPQSARGDHLVAITLVEDDPGVWAFDLGPRDQPDATPHVAWLPSFDGAPFTASQPLPFMPPTLDARLDAEGALLLPRDLELPGRGDCALLRVPRFGAPSCALERADLKTTQRRFIGGWLLEQPLGGATALSALPITGGAPQQVIPARCETPRLVATPQGAGLVHALYGCGDPLTGTLTLWTPTQRLTLPETGWLPMRPSPRDEAAEAITLNRPKAPAPARRALLDLRQGALLTTAPHLALRSRTLLTGQPDPDNLTHHELARLERDAAGALRLRTLEPMRCDGELVVTLDDDAWLGVVCARAPKARLDARCGKGAQRALDHALLIRRADGARATLTSAPIARINQTLYLSDAPLDDTTHTPCPGQLSRATLP